MTQSLNEDDLYRTSTQFRLWSFTPEALASLRAATHSAALGRAKGYLHPNGLHDADSSNGVDSKGGDVTARCLTAEEEVRLVQRYCDQVRTTSDHFKWPVNVKATAVQYLKRFYLTNSCMTYPPKEMYKSVLFLASKTEGTHMSLSEYARRISTEPAQILAPEYKVIQALRFTLDVRQPFRGLKGALMELLNLAAGEAAVLPFVGRDAASLQQEMTALAAPSSSCQTTWTRPKNPTPDTATERAHTAYACARQVLDAPALLTDVYFLYTPPQIYLAALHLADEPLTTFYLSLKLSPTSPARAKIMSTIKMCASMLASYTKDTIMSKDERAALEKKLEDCRDPGTRDMVSLDKKAKRDGAEEGVVDEEARKRRKLKREASAKEGEDLFGPALVKPATKIESGQG